LLLVQPWPLLGRGDDLCCQPSVAVPSSRHHPRPGLCHRYQSCPHRRMHGRL